MKAKLLLEERMYHCVQCGSSVLRDVNAGHNLAREGWRMISESAGTGSVAGRGGEVRPKKQKLASRAHPDESSTDTPMNVGVEEKVRNTKLMPVGVE